MFIENCAKKYSDQMTSQSLMIEMEKTKQITENIKLKELELKIKEIDLQILLHSNKKS